MDAQLKLKTNLDTNLLKLIAIISMAVDHVGTVFFPEYPVFRWIGRLAFPIFCYCMTVGLLYTRDLKKYLLRLAAFAVISQPFYVLAFHLHDWQTEWSNMNIFFTLFVSQLAMCGWIRRKWWLLIGCLALLMFLNFDYGANGLIMMLIFYLLRDRPAWGAALYVLFWLPALWGGDLADPRSLVIGGHAVNWTIFGVLPVLLIYLPTKSGLKIPKWFFYIFYPAHLFAIFAARLILRV